MENYIITVGCEYGAQGNYIAQRIGEHLGIPVYDRETVDAIIDEVGISQEIMEKVEAGITITGKGAEGQERAAFSRLSDLTNRAIHVQSQIIRKLAERASCVFVGRSADFILKDNPRVVNIFIYAPHDVRMKNVMESHSLSEKDAKILITEQDKRHHARYKAITGSYRGDRHNRNLLIDSSLLGVEGTAEYVEIFVRKFLGI